MSLTSPTVALYGLGTMGWPIAMRLKQRGLVVHGFDQNKALEQRWRAIGTIEDSSVASVILVCVTDERASRQVFADHATSWSAHSLVIELGTVSADWARQCQKNCAAAGLRYADAPISGGATGALAGSLVAMLGAQNEDLQDIEAILKTFSSEVHHLGPPGAGQLCKMANQLAIAGVAAGICEAQAFSRRAGLDWVQVLKVLQAGSASSLQLNRLASTLGEANNQAARDFAWLEKDLELCQLASKTPLALNTLWRGLWYEPENQEPQ